MVCNVIVVMEDFECWPKRTKGKEFLLSVLKTVFCISHNIGAGKIGTLWHSVI